MASRDFGAQLLQGRRRNSHRDTSITIQAGVKRRCTHASASVPPGKNTPTPGPSSAASSENQALWQSILMTVQCDVPPAEFATWLAETALLDVDHTRQIVVVGTPNVFARDVIQQQHLPTLSAELAAQLQQTYAIHITVDGG